MTALPRLAGTIGDRGRFDAFVEDAPRRAPRPAVALSPSTARALGLFVPLACGILWLLRVDLVVVAALPVAAAFVLAAPLLIARATGKRAVWPDAVGPLGAAFAAVCAGVAATGAASPFLLLALAVVVAEGALVPGRRLAVALPSSAVALCGALWVSAAGPGALVADALVLLGFGMLGRALFFGTLKAVQLREEARVDGELLRLYDDARLFGLLGSAEPDDEDAADKRLVAQTLAVRDGCYRLLRLGARALSPDAAGVYLLDARGKELVLKEQLVDVEGALVPRVSASAGALGLALKRAQAIRLLDADGPAVQVHRRGARSVLCAPLRDGAQIRGVLVFDRSHGELFTDHDETFALLLCEELVALLRTERVLERLDFEHKKIGRIFGAARAFGGVVRLDDAMEHALRAAVDLCPSASAAVLEIMPPDVRTTPSATTLVGPPPPSMRVRAAAGPLAALLATDDVMTVDDHAWAGRAVLQRTALPHVSLADAGTARGLFTADDERARAVGDLRAIPLFAQGEAVACLVVVVPPGERLRPATIESLVVAADLAGVAIGGARLFETVQRQATTDGLTGLLNRRTLDEKLAEAVARARRMRTPLCTVLVDVDHFKSVNDTYGHGTGDDVLRGISRALAETVRTSDVVARYGGEELCAVLEGTDAAGAHRLAERMRLAVKGLRFDTEKGPVSVTASFGVGVFAGGDDARALLEKADAGLYKAKQSGRDRVVAGG